MDHPRDFYQILHVHPDAPTEIIRSSYRTLMQRLRQHPDLGGDHESAALINEAYATLIDPVKRAEYDRRRGAQGSRAATPNAAAGPATAKRGATWHTYRGMGLGQCGFCRAPHDHGADPVEDALCDNCASPLWRTARHTASEPGLRALERFPKRQLIRFYTSWPASAAHAGRTRDISLDGMQFETTEPLTVNQMIKIDCDVCRAVGRVAHLHEAEGTWTVGVEFVTLMFEKVQGTFVSAEV